MEYNEVMLLRKCIIYILDKKGDSFEMYNQHICRLYMIYDKKGDSWEYKIVMRRCSRFKESNS